MLIKITEPGWEAFNSDLGCVPFENGVSTRDVAHHEALRLGAFVRVVEIDEEGNEIGPVSPAHDIVEHQGDFAEVIEPLQRAVEAEGEVEATEVADDTVEAPAEAQEPAVEAAPHKYTKDELEAIASEGGIIALRPIGNALNVKNTSIKGLIAEILNAQDNPQTKA